MSVESLKDTALHRISKIVDEVFEDSEVYSEELDKDEFIQHMLEQLDNGLLPKKVTSINAERLTRIVRQHMAFNLLGALLEGLTPEQIRIFDEAVEGR